MRFCTSPEGHVQYSAGSLFINTDQLHYFMCTAGTAVESPMNAHFYIGQLAKIKMSDLAPFQKGTDSIPRGRCLSVRANFWFLCVLYAPMLKALKKHFWPWPIEWGQKVRFCSFTEWYVQYPGGRCLSRWTNCSPFCVNVRTGVESPKTHT